jgi:hypothetical protein
MLKPETNNHETTKNRKHEIGKVFGRRLTGSPDISSSKQERKDCLTYREKALKE